MDMVRFFCRLSWKFFAHIITGDFILFTGYLCVGYCSVMIAISHSSV